jgi:hypothetical protein
VPSSGALRLLIEWSLVRIQPGEPKKIGSVPDTCVTVYTDDMVNTFGPKGFAIGSSLQVSSSK